MSMRTKKQAHSIARRKKLRRKNALATAVVGSTWSARNRSPLSKWAADNSDALNKMTSYGLTILPVIQ